MTQPVKEPAYLTVEEVAEILRASPKTVYRLAKDDPTMPMLRLGGLVRFPRERLLMWLRQREQGRPPMRKPVLSVANPLKDKRSAHA